MVLHKKNMQKEFQEFKFRIKIKKYHFGIFTTYVYKELLGKYNSMWSGDVCVRN